MITRQRQAPRAGVLALLITVLVGLLVTLVPTASAASPSPSPSASGKAGSTPAKKAPVSTYGIGPASTKGVDGRPSLSFFVSPGATGTDHVAVLDISAQSLKLSLYVANATNTNGGGVSFLGPSQHPTDAATWIQLGTPDHSTAITVKGRSTTIYPVTFHVPANASPGDHTVGISVALAAGLVGPNSKNATFEQAVTVPVYFRVSGPTRPAFAVAGLKASYHGTLNPGGSGSVSVSYVVRNTGNVNLSGKQAVTISGLFGAKHVAVADVPLLLPGSSAPVSVSVSGVWPQLLIKGRVQVTPVAAAGDVDPGLTVTSATATVWAVPWSLIVIVVLIALLIVVWFWLRHRTPRSAHAMAAGKAGPGSHSKGKSRSRRSLGEATP